MKIDRNTALGFGILAILFVGYFWYLGKEHDAAVKEKARQDSIVNLTRPKADTVAQRIDSVKADSANKIIQAGIFVDSTPHNEQVVYLQNSLLKIAFTTKGGQPKGIELKNYKGQDSTPVKLAATDFDEISYPINTGGHSTFTSELYFSKIDSTKNADGGTSISLTLVSPQAPDESITHTYTIHPDNYLVDFNIQLKGADKLLTQNLLNLSWKYTAAQQESDLSFEKQNTQIGFVENNDFDYFSAYKRSDITFNKDVKWIGIRQRFFNTFLIAKDKFASGNISWTTPADSTRRIMQATTLFKINVQPGSQANVGLSFLYGPTDYHMLKKYDQDFEKIVNLGQGMYAFVRPLNKYVIMPIFDFMQGLVGSYGIAILLLTLFIRLLISPLTYKSYLSGAKTKALRPETVALKAKFPDQQQYSVEQMKLFREAGVNPLGGCIPALLQIPIFFALYSFFNSNVGLRGEHFLWAKDLSAFDNIIPVNIPLLGPLLGHHLSLFTITAVVTSFLISLYSMSMTPDQNNPVMKYMPYIFPIFLLFIFNRLPSALTWYYTVSNLVTLALQFVIQNYIIDHKKILVQIAENRKKPKTKSKWAERMEQMQEQQKKMKDQQRPKR